MRVFLIVLSFHLTGLTKTSNEHEAKLFIDTKKCKSGFEDDDVKFYIYNRIQQSYSVFCISETNVNTTQNLNQSLWTKIYVHGWIQNYEMASIIVERYAKKNVNIIVIDWSKHSGCPYLYVANYIVRNVADVLFKFISHLYKAGFSPNKIHIIGHSFGAHIAGLASTSLRNKKVFRVTGLDPSRIPFDVYSPEHRLNALSAKFVDVIKTSIFGSTLSIGHLIFYPNDGSNQPGCIGIYRALCDHGKSVTYYAESIESKVGFYARQCPQYSVFHNDDADTVIQNETLMGEYVPYNVSGRYCAETNEGYPYARGRSKL